MNDYLTNRRLADLDQRLSERDRAILGTLRLLRYLKTDQIRRLYFPTSEMTDYAAARATARNLKRLYDWGLIDHLPNRVGSGKHGSSGFVWYISEGGHKLISAEANEKGKRHRMLEPSPLYRRHTLAVSEAYVQITEICRKEPGMNLKELVIEPECWRIYEKNSKQLSLRPDLYAETVSGDYIDHWFIEMDLDTEAIATIIDKCRRYHEYYQTNKEQHAIGVYPVVLWIVPDENRKEKIVEAIQAHFTKRYPHIFRVIIPGEFHGVLRDGVKEEELC